MKRPQPRLWKQTEPIRLWLYGIAGPVLALLGFYGVISDASADLWITLVVAALGTGMGGEAARTVAYSPATVRAHQDQSGS